MNSGRKLAIFSIATSVVMWLAFSGLLLIPMSEGGFPAVACLFMLTFWTAVLAVDILCTVSLMKPKRGCLSVLYFVVWSIVGVLSFFLMGIGLTTPVQGSYVRPGLLTVVIAVAPVALAIMKLVVGRLMRREMNIAEQQINEAGNE